MNDSLSHHTWVDNGAELVKYRKAGKGSLQEGALACCASIGLSNAEIEAYLDNHR